MRGTLSRRDFLGAGAACAGLAFGVGLAGCAPSSAPTNATGEDAAASPTIHEEDIVETIDCDVVVAGSGTAGTFAAVRAAELGAKVLWLEKNAEKGGTSVYTEGMALINGSLMKQAGIDPRLDELWHAFMECQNWGVAPEILKAYIDNNGPAIDWACDHGAELQYMPVSDDTYWGGVCLDADGKFKHMGEGLLQHLWEFGDTFSNLEFRPSTPLQQLIVENGEVVGAYAKTDKGYICINAHAVLLGTGGFCNNTDMLAKYMQIRPGEIVFYGIEGRDGDGVQMAIDAGGHMHGASAAMYTSGAVSGSTSFHDIANATFGWNPLLRVNQDGIRFVNENLCIENNTAAVNIAIRQQKAAWSIADKPFVKTFIDMGELDFFTGVTVGDLEEEIKSYDSIVSADTLDELAKLMGVDAAALKASVDEYNAIAQGQPDVKFGLVAENVLPVAEGPFYAAKLVASSYSTEGGPATDENMRVLDADLSPIKGLYALGNDNGSLMFTNYPMHVVGGTAQGWAATSGFVAAAHAVSL